MPTYIKVRTASGAETVTDQLSGTAVKAAGPSGVVRAAFVSTLTTHTAVLRGRKSGKEIIPNGSSPSVSGALTALSVRADDFIFEGRVDPNEELELSITAAAAGTALVAVRTE